MTNKMEKQCHRQIGPLRDRNDNSNKCLQWAHAVIPAACVARRGKVLENAYNTSTVTGKPCTPYVMPFRRVERVWNARYA